MFYWLSVYSSVLVKEDKYFTTRITDRLTRASKQPDTNVAIDLLYYSTSHWGRVTIRPPILIQMRPGKKVKIRRISGTISATKYISKMISKFYRLYGKMYDGFVYSGHSNGIYIGTRKAYLANLSDLKQALTLRVGGVVKKLKVIAFDSCYDGCLESLYELATVCKYMLATPSYHGDQSYLELSGFYRTKSSIVKYLKNLINECQSAEKGASTVE